MGFLRTNTNIIYDTSIWKTIRETHSLRVLANDRKESVLLHKSDILKETDTLEQLCDGFWWEDRSYKEGQLPSYIPNFQVALDKIHMWKQSDEALNTKCLDKVSLYGSIYVPGRGWIHVAKVSFDKEGLEHPWSKRII